MKQKKLLNWVILLCVLGAIASAYLAKVHYSENESFCDFNEQFSCSVVNKGEHAEFFGVPVSLIGLAGYGFLGFIGLGIRRGWGLKKIVSPGSLLFFSLGALLVSLYLTYTEFFVIKIICLMCLFSQVVILGIAFLSHRNLKLGKVMKELENGKNH